MTLVEASTLFHISLEKLKHYEKNNLLSHSVLSDGTFDYTEKEIRRVGVIGSLLKTGMDISTIKRYLNLIDDENSSIEEQIRILKIQRCVLLDDIHARQQALDELDYMIVEAKKLIYN